MTEKSIDDFLDEVMKQREPLSEDERREAMKVAADVWKKALKIAGEKELVWLRQERGNTVKDITIYSEERFIEVLTSARDARRVPRARLIEKYAFLQGEVSKTSTDVISLEIRDFQQDIATLRKRNESLYEQQTVRKSHPNESDLRTLLHSISSVNLVPLLTA